MIVRPHGSQVVRVSVILGTTEGSVDKSGGVYKQELSSPAAHLSMSHTARENQLHALVTLYNVGATWWLQRMDEDKTANYCEGCVMPQNIDARVDHASTSSLDTAPVAASAVQLSNVSGEIVTYEGRAMTMRRRASTDGSAREFLLPKAATR